jgi:hypothetical protein
LRFEIAEPLMPDSTFSKEPFDWLSDLTPAFAAQDLWHDGTYNTPALFHVAYRSEGPFAIACGAGLLAEHIRQFRFSPDIIRRLGQVNDGRGHSVFSESFLNHLQRLRLRVNINAAPEGTLLMPGEPILIAQGPLIQLQLMQTAFLKLFWEPTHWATQSALKRWENQSWVEEDTPAAPPYPFNPDGWKIRAAFIGGAGVDEILANVSLSTRQPGPGEGISNIGIDEPGDRMGELPLIQIRRLYKGNHPLGDVWLTQAHEEKASVSKTTVHFTDARTHRGKTIKFSRFQNLYQPVLAKGHPVVPATRLGYLRQRMLKQLEYFHHADLHTYPHGWFTPS